MTRNDKAIEIQRILHALSFPRSLVCLLFIAGAGEGGTRGRELLAAIEIPETVVTRTLITLADIGLIRREGMNKLTFRGATENARYWITDRVKVIDEEWIEIVASGVPVRFGRNPRNQGA